LGFFLSGGQIMQFDGERRRADAGDKPGGVTR
jgi:hypothetical protein